MPEYFGVDAAYYDSYATGLEGDVQFYLEQACQAGSPVLELGTGTGRILIPIAEVGISIVGLDRSPAMLATAREKISALTPETRQRIELVEGDMRSFSLGKRFKLAMIPYRAFLHLLTVEDQRSALICIREHLTDDGLLAFDIFDPRLDIIAAHLGPLGAAMKKTREFTHPETGHRVVIWDSRQYHPDRQILEEDRIFEELDEENVSVERAYQRLTLRYVFRYEMQHLLEVCGFQVEALYGDFHRGPFRYGGEQIWVARRNQL